MQPSFVPGYGGQGVQGGLAGRNFQPYGPTAFPQPHQFQPPRPLNQPMVHHFTNSLPFQPPPPPPPPGLPIPNHHYQRPILQHPPHPQQHPPPGILTRPRLHAPHDDPRLPPAVVPPPLPFPTSPPPPLSRSITDPTTTRSNTLSPSSSETIPTSPSSATTTTNDENHKEPQSPRTLSRFAPRYIPLWLRQVNHAVPMHIYHLEPLSAQLSRDATSKIEELYPPMVVKRFERVEKDNTDRIVRQVRVKRTKEMERNGTRGTMGKKEGENKPGSSAIAIRAPPRLPNRTPLASPPSISPPIESKPLASPPPPPLSTTSKFPFSDNHQERLEPETYASHWLPIHAKEYEARIEQLLQSNLYNVNLKPLEPFPEELEKEEDVEDEKNDVTFGEEGREKKRRKLWIIPTPFIRESYPPISLSDTLYLRPLVPQVSSWRSLEIEAKVYAIERIKGIVVVRVERDEVEEILERLWRVEERREKRERKQRETERKRERKLSRDREDDQDITEDEEEDEEAEEKEEIGIPVNVIWRIQDQLFLDWRNSTELVDLHLHLSSTSQSSPTPPLSNGSTSSHRQRQRFPIQSWLFPSQQDLFDVLGTAEEDEDDDPSGEWLNTSRRRKVIPRMEGREWVDSNLNDEQRNAVQSILWAEHRLPLLISGPPGTGKTKTCVEAVFQILKDYPNAHILLCGASNPSTDTLALRLRSLMPNQLLRLNNPTRPFNEVRGELLPFCYSEGENFAVPDVTTLLSKRVICTTVNDCSILAASRLSNSNLSTLEHHLGSRLYPGEQNILEPHFKYLICDEAAQATEADLVPALAVVATDPSICRPAHVTLCGDAHQLGPHIVSPFARDRDLDVSLLERLSRLPVYADHPYSRKNRNRQTKPDKSTSNSSSLLMSNGYRKSREEAGSLEWNVRTTPFVDLVRNYRSTEEILWLPSTLFYHETLRPFASQAIQNTSLRKWSTLPNPPFPILFEHVAGEDFEVEEGSSFHNPAELDRVVSLCRDLVENRDEDGILREHGRVRAKEISVISPFREQVWRIRLALRKKGLGDVDVGNVEALQGAENRIIIISPVRSINTRWIEHDRLTNRGLIYEPKRFNVAMTRAKELLLVVGNAETLTMDPFWRAFYHLCRRNRCFVGPSLEHLSNDLSSNAEAVSKMEMEYRGRRSSWNGREVDSDDEQNGIEVVIGRMLGQLNEDEE